MGNINDITVTRITSAVTNVFEKGRIVNMKYRATYGIMIAKSGKIALYHNDKTYYLDNKHILLVPHYSSYILKCTESGFFTVLNFNCIDSYKSDEVTVVRVGESESFIKDHLTIETLMQNKTGNFHAAIMERTYSILTRLNYYNSRYGYNSLNEATVTYIHENLFDPTLSGTSIAKRLGKSEIYIRKTFKAAFGITPMKYLQNERINLAKNLLLSDDDTISEIAFKCGFSDTHIFSRAFKQSTGINPSEYRKLK